MYETYDAATDRNDQLVMLLWLGGGTGACASAFSYGLVILGLI
ncbi:hypothetical protein [Zavarzinella formosa]|nr:hypothetical protein [Zavarzinella formosa]